MATATVPVTSKSRGKQPIVRKRTTKPRSVQSAIAVRRMNGESKSKIARDLGIARHTVTSIVELTDIDQQIGQYRQDALAIVPDAITAVHSQVQAGDGDLGLRLLERTGVIGADAIDTARRMNVRAAGSINVLVQPGASATVVQSDSDSVMPRDDSAKVIDVTATVQSDASNAAVTLDSTMVHIATDTMSVNCGDPFACAPSPTAGAPPPRRQAPKMRGQA